MPGHGGARVGSGQKPGPSADEFGPGLAESPEKPVLMGARAQTIWDGLAPHALRAQTLAPQTAEAFGLLCECMALREAMMLVIARDGMTYTDGHEVKSHPLLAQVRGLIQRIESLMKSFGLSPMGKPLPQTAVGAGPKKRNPWDVQ